ncbi:unnamed protein product [Protopolystoma xenopodis]|uniref:Uncharacterized protein n=1 Tax=Protopolystoma xenopodis TaxID=117903 RepID=A0A448XIP8_9PLAT|nr:unnamed protein product [Protopolystoma xenopodis]
MVAVKCSPQGHTKTSTPSHVSVRPFANSANKSAQADRAMNAAAQTVTPPSRPVRGAESADKSDSFIHSPSGNGSPDPRASASNSFETSKKRRVMDVPQITLNELNSIMERLQQQFNQETDQQEFPIFPKPTKAKRSKPI